MRTTVIVSVLATAVTACASTRLPGQQVAQQEARKTYVSPWKTPWDYEGPRGANHWSQLDPAYAVCNEGKEQSPIDIRDAVKADLPALRFESRTDPLDYVVNNGHTIRVDYARGNGNSSSPTVSSTSSRSSTSIVRVKNPSRARRTRWKHI